ncbi:hypothetical protein CBL_11633 [Carabus blaptoides fortunei]
MGSRLWKWLKSRRKLVARLGNPKSFCRSMILCHTTVNSPRSEVQQWLIMLLDTIIRYDKSTTLRPTKAAAVSVCDAGVVSRAVSVYLYYVLVWLWGGLCKAMVQRSLSK